MNHRLAKFGLALFFFLTTAGAQADTCRDPSPLRVAVIPQMKSQTGHYGSLIETLKDELQRTVLLIPVGSYGAVIEGLYDGTLDLAELGPGSYALARERSTDVTAFASLHRHTDATQPAVYRPVLITRRDAELRSIEALQGRTVSLVDPASTSGGIVPRAVLPRLTGMALDQWFGRVSFAGSHDVAIEAVLNGRVAAAFVADTRVKQATHQGRPATDFLRILWQSGPIPSDPFVYQNRLCEPVKQAIQRVFFERTKDLQSLLNWRNHQGFIPVSDSDYQDLIKEPSSEN